MATRERGRAPGGGSEDQPILASDRALRNWVGEGGDYEAIMPSSEDAEVFVAGAADFIAAVDHMLEAQDASLYFFDRTGFSERLRQIASERANVRLIATGEMG